MKKKPFKVIIRGEDKPSLREVKGYFTWINDIRVFIYYDSSWREWYVIDLDTGFSFANGLSLAKAKSDGYDKLEKFKRHKETEKYKEYRFLYQRLLKEEKNKGE